jgi:hypothetical protein
MQYYSIEMETSVNLSVESMKYYITVMEHAVIKLGHLCTAPIHFCSTTASDTQDLVTL